MLRDLVKNWWLLALCGILNAIYAAVNLVMQNPADGSLTLRTHFLRSTGVFLGRLALAAGVCTIAAALWRSAQGKSRFLVLNGLASSVLGLIFMFWTGPLKFRTIALLLVIMALGIGFYALRLPVPGKLAAAISIAFALTFLAFGFRWIPLGHHPEVLNVWMSAYFAFSAICMLGLAVQRRGPGTAQSGSWKISPPLPAR